MCGIIDRRILVNFRVHPQTAQKLLPPFFCPKLAGGWAIAGICLIRLQEIRPHGVPSICGIASENAAHRIAVEWEEDGVAREGVFIQRRDTSSVLQSFAGGLLFPGVHHRADFEVIERDDHFQLRMQSQDNAAAIELRARRVNELPRDSVFGSLPEASDFFARGSVGYSATNVPNCCDGLELCTFGWKVEPLKVLSVKSSFFDDKCRFPPGTIHFDSALLMRNVEHEWRVLPRLERSL